MLMPDKHIKLGESILGLSAYLMELLEHPQVIDQLWSSFRQNYKKGEYPVDHTFEHLVFAIDVLYAINAVDVDSRSGVLKKCV